LKSVDRLGKGRTFPGGRAKVQARPARQRWLGRLASGRMAAIFSHSTGAINPARTYSSSSVAEVVWHRDSTSCSGVEKNASEAGLSKRDPTLPINCRTPDLRHSIVKSIAV
jgi:hypothetical protein